MTGPGIRTAELLRFRIAAECRTRCIEQMLELMSCGRAGRYLACVNPHSLATALNDSDFSEALSGADLLLPDGIGVVLACRFTGGRVAERVTGSDAFFGLSRALHQRGGARYFLLGSSEDNLRRLRAVVEREFPRISVAGTFAPPVRDSFTPEEDAAMVAAVNRVRPDVLWVAMTAPKQEKWVHRHRAQLQARLIAPVGAVFDYATGRVPRPHRIFQDVGLEWLPRLVREPARLWRRTVLSAPRFAMAVLREQRGRAANTPL